MNQKFRRSKMLMNRKSRRSKMLKNQRSKCYKIQKSILCQKSIRNLKLKYVVRTKQEN